MRTVSANSRRRLVLLGRLLASYPEEYITSVKIEKLTGWSASLVRRDLWQIQVKTGASNGYRVRDLQESISNLLKFSQEKKKCCIVGLGHTGQALLDSSELYDSPFTLVAGFDSNVNRTEVLRSVFPLHPTTQLEKVIKEQNITYAILASSASEAQELADRLVSCGIKGIVNYTPCVLSVPENVYVENVCILTALENLCAQAEI